MNDDKKPEAPAMTEESPVTTHHETTIGGELIPYSATVGRTPMKDEKGEILAQIFSTSYVREGIEDPAARPVFFVFNGGPGSSSIWLHLGAVGPRRARMEDEGFMPAPPYQLVVNEHSWLDLGDLVFIDPVGTGFSRAKDEEQAKKYWNPKSDIESVGEFIRRWLGRNGRWASPLYLAGESYGTMRSGGLSEHLLDHGIGLSGIVLISSVLNLGTLRFDRGNELPYPLFLPSFTATAWYHGRLPEDLMALGLDQAIAEAKEWATTDYVLALMKGDRLAGGEFVEVVDRVTRYTGLERRYVERSRARIEIMNFCRELLRDEGRTVGRLDSRFPGLGRASTTDYPFDPSMVAITPPYTQLLNDYVRRELEYESDLEYEVLSGTVSKGWEWERGVYADTSEKLRLAFAGNPHMKVLVTQGRYDLATPFAAIDYTLNHMELDPEVRGNITTKFYEAGHMLYIDLTQLARLKADVAEFVTAMRWPGQGIRHSPGVGSGPVRQ
jgi:carboxypeptidase C (cathepsin A)